MNGRCNSRDGLSCDPWGMKADEILEKDAEIELEALERVEAAVKKRKAKLAAEAMERALEEEELDLDKAEDDVVPGSEADIKVRFEKHER